MRRKLFFFLLSPLILFSCKGFQESAKFGLSSGYYKAKTKKDPIAPVYLYAHEDTLRMYFLDAKKKEQSIGKDRKPDLVLPETTEGAFPSPYILKERSMDVDVLTIPFKYRFPTADMERQLGTQFNGALYAGYRIDRYRIGYELSPIGIASRNTLHYGYSIGLFSGIGAESINPWVTRDRYPGEYEGVAWSKGIAAIIGINNFNVGFGLGFDHLLDSNRDIWIYQGEPWLGLVLGLNLN